MPNQFSTCDAFSETYHMSTISSNIVFLNLFVRQTCNSSRASLTLKDLKIAIITSGLQD